MILYANLPTGQKKAAKWVVHCRKKISPFFPLFFLERFRHFSLTPDMFSRPRYCYGIAAIRRTRGSPTFLTTSFFIKKKASLQFLFWISCYRHFKIVFECKSLSRDIRKFACFLSCLEILFKMYQTTRYYT